MQILFAILILMGVFMAFKTVAQVLFGREAVAAFGRGFDAFMGFVWKATAFAIVGGLLWIVWIVATVPST